MKLTQIINGAVGRSEFINPERLVNLFPQMDPSGKAVVALYGTPGLLLLFTLGAGPIRAMLSYDDVLYVVSGSNFYSVDTNYSATLRGTLASGSGYVSIATNGLVVLMVDGSAGYTFTISGATFAAVTDADFPDNPEVTVCCDGYFLVFDSGTQRVYFTTTGTAWDALDFFSAEATPDNLISMLADHNDLILFGITSTEIWRLTGTGWQVTGTLIEFGCAAEGSPAKIDNSVLWLAHDLTVRRLSGPTPVRMSKHDVEYRIKQHTKAEIASATAFSYNDEGHSFYQLTVGNETFVYDVAMDRWHTRSYKVPLTGAEIQHRAKCHAFFNGLNMVGDYENGRVYEYDMDTYTDNGDEIASTGTYRPLNNEGKYLFVNRVEIEVENGVGTQSGQGSDPQIELRISYDAGNTWEPWDARDIGPIGLYDTTCVWDGLGGSVKPVIEFRITDPIKRVIANANLEVTVSR